MRIILILSIVFTFLVGTPKSNAFWFFNNHQHEQELQQQLDHAQHTNGGLELVILFLTVGCVVALFTGTAIGSKTKREAKNHEQPEQ